MQLQAVRTVASGVDLIEVKEARDHCRIDTVDDDATIEALVAAVTDYLSGPDGILRPTLLKQTWRDAWSGFPADRRLRLTAEPMMAVSAVEYVAAGATTWSTLAADQYWAYSDALGGWVELADASSWPDTATRPEAVRVTYTAGFGDKASDVPRSIVHAAKLLVGQYYENREVSIIGTIVSDLPFAVTALLRPYARIPV